jgi:hypothetical protein
MSRFLRVLVGVVVLLGFAAVGVVSVHHRGRHSRRATAAASCTYTADKSGDAAREREDGGKSEPAEEHERGAGDDAAKEAEEKRERERTAQGPEVSGLFAGPAGNEAVERCDTPGHPEFFDDLAKANSSLLTREVAPGTQLKPGAQRSAVRAADALPQIGGTWSPYGKTPMLGNRTDYDTTRGSTKEGFVGLAGRTTGFARDADGNLYAATSNGGIWKSTDGAGNWTAIGDSLPTQVVSGIAWSPANGGTLIVLTGDNAFGGDTYAGLGVYRSTDGGATWQHSSGIADGLLGFKVAVDPTNANVL